MLDRLGREATQRAEKAAIMIPVANPIPEPAGFDEKCRQKGRTWLIKNPDPQRRPKDFWGQFRPDLAHGFSDRCGYSAMWITSGTIDHFVSYGEDRKQAYE